MVGSSTLLATGALIATLASLRASRGGARLALAALPLGVGLSVAFEPTTLDLWGWSASSGELLSATLKLDVPGEGLKVLSAPLHVAHPLSGWLGYAWSALSALAMLSLWAKRAPLTRLALGGWVALSVLWLLASPVGGFLFLGGAESGESALRDWLMMNPSVNAERLSAFTLPAEPWRWAPHRVSLIAVASLSALLGALLPSSAQGGARSLEGTSRALYQLGALASLVGLGWQLASSGGFLGAAPSWVALISLAVGGLLAHTASQAMTLSLLALAAVTL